MFDKLLYILIGVFFLLFGLLHATNIEVAWGEPLMGFCALAAGVVCIIRAVR